ncbi:hypothetical protein TRFO_11765 [Tritrichomonas foetus]|uniref:Uncharacterized protein n=1 Tax=Tritrichomonas foetus TaxID=1144522 RepID=A0A1J4J2F3_9EUKA|nr:hypothetical protein TRFO_11765 [Tritrichomonas foetus]|eukprot:OHS93546.1 hypothetical protein TRFO_11765 [Tritrichomonas foetus]
MVSFLPPTFYFALLVLYFIENRFSGYIPTISETGTELPNNDIMVPFFCCIAGSIFYQLSSLSAYVITFYKTNIISRFFLRIITYISSISYILIALFPMDKKPSQHFSSTFLAFFGIIIFQLIVLFSTRCDYSFWRCIVRFIYIIFQVVPLVVCAISSHVWNNRVNVTIQAFGEYSLVILLPFFFISFSKELSNTVMIISADQ